MTDKEQKRKPLIPFSWLPGSWGLKGKTYEIAKAEYELNGYDLERKLAELQLTGLEKDLKLLDIEYECKNITEREYQKQKATLKNEPWVEVIKTEFDKKDPKYGSLELDWNKQFIDMLVEKGYIGKTDEDTIDEWLSDLCKNIALQEYADIGDFSEKMAELDDNKKLPPAPGRREIF